METTTLVAPDISCEHCQHAIEGALGKLAGVNTVRVDIPTKTVILRYDPQKVTLTKIEEMLDDTGYQRMLRDGAPENEERWANVTELTGLAAEYADVPPPQA